MKKKDTVDEAISIMEVAKYFNVSVRTIRTWQKRDKTFPRPFKKFGTVRFRKSEIEEYWKQNPKKCK